MKITISKVEALNPCKDRFDNFVNNNPGFKGSLEAFLSLDNITYNDKVWVCVRLMTRNQKFFWARACAWSVLDIFEAKRLNDNRVRALLDHLDTIDDIAKLTEADINKIRELRDAAAKAAANAAYVATNAAAYVAANAATYAANAAYSAYAAAYAANAANAANATRKHQEDYNLIILKQIMELDI